MVEAKLNDEQRAQIREAWAHGEKQHILSQQFGVSQARVSQLVEGIPKVRASSLKPKRCCKGCGVPLRYKTRCESCNRAWRNDKEKKRQAAVKARQEASH